MVLGELREFKPRDADMYTIIDVMEAKYGCDGREYIETMGYFDEIAGDTIGSLTYNKLMTHAKKLLDTPVYRGGGNTKQGGRGGTKKYPEPMTVLRKFAYLSSAINHMVKQGIHLDNNCLKVVAYLRELDKKKKEKKNGKHNSNTTD